MDLSQKIPSYITEKKNSTRLIIFTALFALIFINLYSPFEVTELMMKAASFLDIGNPELVLFISSSIIILTGVLVVVISRIILYQRTKRWGSITLSQFFIWIALEVIAMAVFYALYEKIFLSGFSSFLHAFKISIQNTALVLLLPYSISWLYFSWIEKNRMLEKLKEGDITDNEHKGMIVFYDEKGTMRMSMKFSELLYLQAADNYVYIVYTNQDKIAKYMLRSSLKLIEDTYKEFPLIRCHRSYMVNFEKVRIIKREKDGLIIILDSPIEQEIPVSKTFMEQVFKAFGENLE